MKKLLSILMLGLLIGIPIGCGTTPKSITYKTLYGLEQVTVSAYDGYLQLVIQGRVRTNSVPQISRDFNQFQAAMQAAIELANHSTNAMANASLIIASEGIVSTISQEKGVK